MELIRYTGSPNYPLPPDYLRMDLEAQRVARMNAVCLQETPDDLVVAWNFFCDYYLGRSKAADSIEPLLPKNFFYKRRLPSPPLHNEMVRDMAAYPRTVCGAPRSSAKSTVVGKTLPLLLLLTRPYFDILSVLATDLLVKDRSNDLILQIEHNARIRADFGDMKPARGDGMWSKHKFSLKNGASLTGISLGGKMLGKRPDLILFDDPEYDPEGSTAGQSDPEKLADELERLLFDTLDPMLDEATEEGEAGTVLYWVGTLVHHKALIHHAVTTTDDKRFTHYYNRRIHDAETGPQAGQILWKEKWSLEFLARERDRLGPRSYNLTYMNKPMSGHTLLFDLVPRHFYKTDASPPFTYADPFQADCNISFVKTIHEPGKRPHAEIQEVPAADWLSRMYRLCTVDPSRKRTARSDFACVIVVGFDQYNRMWVLDIHHAKRPGSEILDVMWDMCLKWRCHVAGIEDAGTQGELVERATTDLRRKSLEAKHVPRIVGVKYPAGIDKGERIASALEWRFSQYWCLLPAGVEHLQHWKPLFHQIRNFTADLGHLKHDDAIDALGMTQYVPGRGRGRPKHLEAKKARSPLEHIRDGEVIDPDTGLNWLHGVNFGDLTAEDHRRLADVRTADADLAEETEEGILWMR